MMFIPKMYNYCWKSRNSGCLCDELCTFLHMFFNESVTSTKPEFSKSIVLIYGADKWQWTDIEGPIKYVFGIFFYKEFHELEDISDQDVT